MPTLADSPEAKTRLTEIKPNEVSIVDMPANGEPFIVIKRNGGDMDAPSKLSEKNLPRLAMKTIHKRVLNAIDSVKFIQDVVKSMPAEEAGESVNAPSVLVSMLKSVASEIRSLNPKEQVPAQKMLGAESILSVQDIIKRAEDIEKANAVSYLMRDEYVSVTTNVTEYLTTYVEAVEHDDAGPMLIPSNLDQTTEDSATALEKLAEKYPPSENEEVEPDGVAEINKLNDEIARLKKAIEGSSLTKRGSKMATERLNRLKSVSSGVESAASELSKLVGELEENNEEGDETMATDTVTKSVDSPVASTEPTPDTTPGTIVKMEGQPIVTNDAVMKAIKDFSDRMEEKFKKIDEIDTRIGGLEQKVDKAQVDVEKVLISRGDTRNLADNETTKPVTKSVDESSFAGLLGL